MLKLIWMLIGGHLGRGKGELGWVGSPTLRHSHRRLDAQRLLKSSFFLLQSICGARLLLRFWWALSLATAREMLKSKMGSEEEEVDEGSVESCLLGLSWEFSCKEEEGVKCPPLRDPCPWRQRSGLDPLEQWPG